MLAAHIGRVVVPHQLRVIAGDFFPDFMRGGLSAHAAYLAFAGIRNKMLHGFRFPFVSRYAKDGWQGILRPPYRAPLAAAIAAVKSLSAQGCRIVRPSHQLLL